jgi:5-methylcytosine-specific restriction endonuclease McrA
METKRCPVCKTIKNKTEFHKSKNRHDGVASTCKSCSKTKRRLRYIKNKDRELELSKKYYQENKEYYQEWRDSNKETIKVANKEYNSINKDKISEQKKKYYEENKERISKKKKIYSQSHSGKAVMRNGAYKRRLKKKNSSISSEDIKNLIKNATKCYWCGKKLTKDNTHIDHYVPLSKGGLHELENLVVSCNKCNLTKSAKDPIEFANSVGKLL